jgi:hypothetical protein
MDKENVVYMLNDVLFSHKEDWNYVNCRKMYGTGTIKLSEISQSHNRKYWMFFSHTWILEGIRKTWKKERTIRIVKGERVTEGMDMNELHYAHLWENHNWTPLVCTNNLCY